MSGGPLTRSAFTEGRHGGKRRVAFKISFNRTASSHLGGFKRHERNVILDGIEEQLTHEPTAETRHRKELRDNPFKL